MTSRSDNAQASKASGSASSIGPLRTTISALTSKSRDGLGIGGNKRRAAEGAPSRPLRRPVRLVTPDRAEILHPEAVARPLGVTRRHRYGGLALSTVFVQSEPRPALLNGVPGSAIGQVLLDLATAGERVPRHHQFESAGSRWFHREDARTRGRHHGRMLHLCRRESNTPDDAEYNAKFHMVPGLRQQFRVRRPDLQRFLAPGVHRHAQRLLQRQADTRHRAVVAGDVITGLQAAAGAAGNQDRQTVYGMDPGVGSGR